MKKKGIISRWLEKLDNKLEAKSKEECCCCKEGRKGNKTKCSSK